SSWGAPCRTRDRPSFGSPAVRLIRLRRDVASSSRGTDVGSERACDEGRCCEKRAGEATHEAGCAAGTRKETAIRISGKCTDNGEGCKFFLRGGTLTWVVRRVTCDVTRRRGGRAASATSSAPVKGDERISCTGPGAGVGCTRRVVPSTDREERGHAQTRTVLR